jgi:hypothetical protein
LTVPIGIEVGVSKAGSNRSPRSCAILSNASLYLQVKVRVGVGVGVMVRVRVRVRVRGRGRVRVGFMVRVRVSVRSCAIPDNAASPPQCYGMIYGNNRQRRQHLG